MNEPTAPPGFWVREDGHAPLPPTPLSRPFWEHRRWLRVVGEEMGFLFDTLDVQEIGGWLYLRVVPLVDEAGPPPPASLAPAVFDAVPALRQRVARCVAAVRGDVAGGLVNRWYGEWRAEFAARIAALREIDPAAMTDDELVKHYDAALALGEDGSQVHFRLWGAIVVALGAFEFTCRELLGWADARSLDLLRGTSVASTEPARAMEELVVAANRSDAVGALLRSGAGPDRVLAADPDFAAAFARYLADYGVRALAYDLGDPTLAERPDVILDLLRDRLEHGAADVEAARETAAQAIAEARRILADREPAERERFERDLGRALTAYPAREDNEFFTISSPLAVLRGTALHIGGRLAARKQIDAVDDVFFLEVPEMLAALTDGAGMHAAVSRRRAERAWTLAHPGPAAYGTPAAPPPLDSLPAEVRQVNQALGWALEHIAAPSGHARAHAPSAPVIRGLAASPGRYRGRVRVIRDQSEFAKLRSGDVLVCPVSSPVWSVLFGTAAALVTDRGGILSHSAIIAREFGIPAVVATGDATGVLRDGQFVTVDGTAGTVRVENSEGVSE